jgi:hypothetical protein
LWGRTWTILSSLSPLLSWSLVLALAKSFAGVTMSRPYLLIRTTGSFRTDEDFVFTFAPAGVTAFNWIEELAICRKSEEDRPRASDTQVPTPR